MNKLKYLLILLVFSKLLNAQSVDLSSIDTFFNLTTTLKSGGEISDEQWMEFDSTTVYKRFSSKEDKFVINTIKESMQLVFDKTNKNSSRIDSILSISKVQIKENRKLLLTKFTLDNYININKNYNDIQSFRGSYDFNGLIDNSKLELSSFLGQPIDSISNLKPLHFFFMVADAQDGGDAILVDLNLIYRLTEEQRIKLITHEYFHNYRRRFENHDFNYKCDLNHMIDMIQNEGIADMIDKTEGYEKHFSNDVYNSDLSISMVELYNTAEKDLERLHDLIIRYSLDEISKDSMVDGLLEIVKINGHPIGFYMSNQIVDAGYRDQMIESFYDPYEFYKLYNKAAKQKNMFQLSDEFMEFIFE